MSTRSHTSFCANGGPCWCRQEDHGQSQTVSDVPETEQRPKLDYEAGEAFVEKGTSSSKSEYTQQLREAGRTKELEIGDYCQVMFQRVRGPEVEYKGRYIGQVQRNGVAHIAVDQSDGVRVYVDCALSPVVEPIQQHNL